jgi:hypothetical protein
MAVGSGAGSGRSARAVAARRASLTVGIIGIRSAVQTITTIGDGNWEHPTGRWCQRPQSRQIPSPKSRLMPTHWLPRIEWHRRGSKCEPTPSPSCCSAHCSSLCSLEYSSLSSRTTERIHAITWDGRRSRAYRSRHLSTDYQAQDVRAGGRGTPPRPADSDLAVETDRFAPGRCQTTTRQNPLMVWIAHLGGADLQFCIRVLVANRSDQVDDRAVRRHLASHANAEVTHANSW